MIFKFAELFFREDKIKFWEFFSGTLSRQPAYTYMIDSFGDVHLRGMQ